MVLNILEGATQEIHQPIPINVNVNAEFSKYTITPLKTINFGPMQYGAQESRSFEIRNDGLFEFKYSVCDFNDKEAKAKIREERQKEIDERINGAQEAAAEDPKKAAGKAPAKDKGKPGAKGAAKDEPAGDKLIVGQYEVTPSTGSIPPGQSGTL
jgi:hydrocephalus-inducing protein